MDNIDLSIIIVNYNSKKYLLDCLNSVKKWSDKINLEIIVVDNNSSAEKIVREELPNNMAINLILSDKNLGFGGANNLGAKEARGEYIFLLNPDTFIIDDSIKKMLAFIVNHSEIGALTCLLYNDLGHKEMQKSFYGNFQSLAGLTIRRYNYQKLDLSKEFFYTDIVTGAALMIRRELFEKLGGFDEKIFMYLEDDDLCKRIVDMGYKNAVLSTAKIIHLEGKSTTNKQRKKFYYDSQEYYWHKHNGLFPTILMKILHWPIKMIKTNK